MAFWSVKFCVEVRTFQQRNQNYETFSSSLLAVRVGTLVEWRFAKDTLSAVNICRPCCGESFELPVKAVALGINEEDTINTLILYSLILCHYIIYIYIDIDISRESQKSTKNKFKHWSEFHTIQRM